MNASFFYFSGTGNSLDIAKRLVDSLGFGTIRSISKYRNEQSIEINEDILGFIFPVYSQTIPSMVKTFIERLNFKSDPYIFSIATNNGGPGRANFNIAAMIKKKKHTLNFGSTVVMPGNSIIIKDYTNSIVEQHRRLVNVNTNIEVISKHIKNMTNGEIEGTREIKWYLEGIITSIARKIYNVPKRFTIDMAKCTQCRSCVRLCPENNIQMFPSPTFGNNCTNCLSCYHWCPQQAISLGSKKNSHYHNPNVSMNELFLR